MADFEAVLKKTIGGLGANTPEMRKKVYDKARTTITAKLAAIDPPPPQAVVDRQNKALEDAIASVEASYAPEPEEDDLDAIFASLKSPVAVAGKAPEPDEQPAAPATPHAEAGQDGPAPAGEAAPVNGPESDPLAVDELPSLAGSPPRGQRGRSRGRLGVVAALVVLLALAGGGYAVWLNQDAFGDLFTSAEPEPAGVDAPQPTIVLSGEEEGTDGPEEAALDEERDLSGDVAAAETEPSAGEAGEDIAAVAPDEEDGSEPAADPGPDDADAPRKFTQRLLEDGSEVDMGAAEGAGGIGEGTSVATTVLREEGVQAAAPDEADGNAEELAQATEDAPEEGESAEPTVAVGQRAIFYEERTSSAQGSAETGSIVWSLVRESPGGDAPPEPAIRAEASIPERDLQLRMTIRRNVDQTLPASHIVEMIFLTPDGFSGGGIENVLRMTLKRSEEAPGAPLLGIPAKIADGFFLIALSDAEADISQNLNLLEREQWIDIPMVYRSGRRALITLEKGIPGTRVFEQALEAWRSGSSG
ncbi:MAG: hypothetical protein K5872_00345 [Rhizobiaceae bacterium]|nr:hypothetical protein [Rhizobiaceae bacterium]MCV0404656.1 hypothetical protein [Rhizobiaceae bacterium]